jgi:hypothetical protein
MRKSRDELVEEGLDAANSAETAAALGKRTAPWVYYAKVKSGRRATQNIELSAWNLPHLIAVLIIGHARPSENFAVFGIRRVMKKQSSSIREDI